ncbi:MAG: hypothetical protein HY852_05630 [Bradyrhizobium sp.]|uniref:hypothetical protein n=1 Tax=Bradyrhizobium sp. TaxID=376 RepID=UPI0025B89B68|nr:hypothetical protein [Bradyrhizobium sp.]MBI5261284.1 hypothetical protein [Bradyrhizobium sp.]
MKLRPLAAGIFSTIMALGADHPLSDGQPVMANKAAADEIGKQVRDPTVPPARDPAIAVAEEYELARRKGTAEALELFIARHSDDPLAEKARAELRRLSR